MGIKKRKLLIGFLCFLLFLIVLELVYMSGVLKIIGYVGYTVQNISKIAFNKEGPVNLITSLANAKENPFCSKASSQLFYEGTISKIVIQKDGNISITLVNPKATMSKREIVLVAPLRSLEARDNRGNMINISQVKVKSVISVEYNYDYKNATARNYLTVIN